MPKLVPWVVPNLLDFPQITPKSAKKYQKVTNSMKGCQKFAKKLKIPRFCSVFVRVFGPLKPI